MRLWKRASGALKDQNSILLASLTRRTGLRDPEIEATVIKATTHDEYPIDQRYVERLQRWIGLSPSDHLKHVVWAITMRVERTRSWEVALKGLMLMHRVLCFDDDVVRMIGRLPFDLSGFTDGHSVRPEETWGQDAFVRSFFAFLDQKSTHLSQNEDPKMAGHDQLSCFSVAQDLVVLEKLQGLLDVLLQVRPHHEVASLPLLAEAMDMVVHEVYDIYGRICSGVARVLLRIYTAGKEEAKIALRVVQKATAQGESLTSYFELCADLGFINHFDCPKVKQIPHEDIQELQDIINGTSSSSKSSRPTPTTTYKQNLNNKQPTLLLAITKSSHHQPQPQERVETKGGLLRTVVTDRWETFDDEEQNLQMLLALSSMCGANNNNNNVRASSICHKDLPDLISFTNLLSV